jgi:hypothetical protein
VNNNPPPANSSAGTTGNSGSAGMSSGAAGMGAPVTGAAGGGGQSAGGAPGSAGTGTAGSSAPGAGTGGMGNPSGDCGQGDLGQGPFGCGFAWGTNDPGGSLTEYSYLQFMSKWVGYEVTADGTLPRCDGCGWLSQQVANTSLVPVYYAYFIGYYGHANGLPDGNEMPNGPNLTTGGAALIRAHRAAIIEMYAYYARETYKVWKKPLLWLLEGDQVQYTRESQSQPLTFDELAQLTAEIACAIKSNMPTAKVAINHSTWNADQVTRDFWGAMDRARVSYDLVWTTGVANNDGYFEASSNASSYNHETAKYAAVSALTGRKILVDTSFGLSAMADTWVSASSATLNARIADGVIAANITPPPSGRAVTAAAMNLDPTCD